MDGRLIRDLFTGEVKEVPFETDGQRTVIAAIGPPGGAIDKSGNFWRAKGWSGLALGVHPKQAKEFTRQAHAAGITDVSYCPTTGRMQSSSREGRAAEAARRGRYDDCPGDVECRYASLLGK